MLGGLGNAADTARPDHVAAGSLAGGLAARLLTMPAMALALPRAASFDVLLGKNRIGRHAIAFTAQGEGFRAATTIDLTVKVAFFTVLDLHHQSEELWQGGRLIRMRSTTRDGKDKFEVAADAGPEGPLRQPGRDDHHAARDVHLERHLGRRRAARQSADRRAERRYHRTGRGWPGPGAGQGRGPGAARRALPVRDPGAAGDLWYADAELVEGRLEVRGETVDYLRVAERRTRVGYRLARTPAPCSRQSATSATWAGSGRRSMREVRIGLIGAGWMGKAHGIAYQNRPWFGTEPAVPSSRSWPTSTRNGQRRRPRPSGFARWTEDWREVVADPKVDAIDITAPITSTPRWRSQRSPPASPSIARSRSPNSAAENGAWPRRRRPRASRPWSASTI